MSERPLCKDCKRPKNPDKTFPCVASNKNVTKENCLEKRKDNLKQRRKR